MVDDPARLSFVAFTQEALAALRGTPMVSSVRLQDDQESLSVTCALPGGGVEVEASFYLPNYYARYVKSGDLDEELGRIVRGLEDIPASMISPSIEEVRALILPKLMRAQPEAEMVVSRPFFASLRLAYVVDATEVMRYITAQHLDDWGIDLAALHALAMENLRLLMERSAPQTVDSPELTLWCSATCDGFDASRLLLPDRIEAWVLGDSVRRRSQPRRRAGRHAEASGPPPPIVIGIPHRDMLVATVATPEVIPLMRAIVKQFHQPPYSLTEQLFTIVDGRVELWDRLGAAAGIASD